ncbi:MAG: 2,4-dihydroxyhept-2-ene-1,7-dioic acid aldolase [Acidobacteria bacterium]|nr:2,4-dihydroxyhept-2-ene-1,7-dioic acid aldolase [Acidobacteriota bacterium]
MQRDASSSSDLPQQKFGAHVEPRSRCCRILRFRFDRWSVDKTVKNALKSGGDWNPLKRHWREDKTAFGAIVTTPSPQIVQWMAQADLDWILIDLEHGAIDLAAAHAMIAATSGTDLVPLVRVASKDGWQAKIPMDLGALGVCFPMTTTRADAEAAVRATKYPPEGERLWGPFSAAPRWGVSVRDYVAKANDEMLAVGTLEHVDAVRSVKEIASTPGLDVLFIGPGDLATSMGLKGCTDSPEMADVVRKLEEGVLRSDAVLGGVATTADQANAMIEKGYRMLVLGFDWSLLQRGIAAALAGVRR